MMQVVVLGGGNPRQLGLVYKSYSSRSLVPLPGGRLIDHIYGAFEGLGVDVWFVSDDPNALRYAAERGMRVIEQRGEGISAAIRSAVSRLRAICSREELVTIIYGDVYAEREFYRQPIVGAERGLVPGIVVTVPAYIHERFMRIDVNDVDRTVIGIGEGGFVYAGASVLRFRDLEEWSRAADIEGFLRGLRRLYAIEWLGPWVDMDTPWDYMVAIRLHLDRLRGVYISDTARVSDRAVIDGPVYVDDSARIDHYAVLKGPVYVGRGCLVGVNAFLRDHAFLAPGAVVGAYTEFKRSIALDAAYIASHCYIADSVVGESASVAPFTVTRNIVYDVSRVPESVRITTSMPLERLKLGAVITAGAHVEPHATLKPLTIV